MSRMNHVKGRTQCSGVSVRPTGKKLIVRFYRPDGTEGAASCGFNPRRTLASQVSRLIGEGRKVKNTEIR